MSDALIYFRRFRGTATAQGTGGSSVKIKFLSSGSKELVKALKAAEDVAIKRGRLEYATLAGARVISYEAERLAPKDTGRAAKTIRARLVASRPGEAVVQVGPSSRGYYLYYHEMGTRHMIARPFLTPAFDHKQAEAIRTMADHYKRSLDRAVRRGRV